MTLKFRGGVASLYLVETLGEWTGRQYERIHSARRWDEWLRGAKLPRPPQRASEDELAQMRALRRAIYGVVQAVRAGHAPARGDVDAINAFAREMPPAPQLSGAGDKKRLDRPISHAQVLGLIAQDAIELLTGELRDRIRACASPVCPVLFVDKSRRGDRQWCSAACGARKATARYRLRLAGRELDEETAFCVEHH
ncbi:MULTISPECIES: CGNR zinc finger domain-containing protein [Cupriavidus]